MSYSLTGLRAVSILIAEPEDLLSPFNFGLNLAIKPERKQSIFISP